MKRSILFTHEDTIIDEAIDETGDWFMFPVSLRSRRFTVILRLQAPAGVG